MKKELYKDLLIIGVSLIVAVVLALSGGVESFLNSTKDIEIFGAFVSGLFFVSVFTAAPAGVVFVEIVLGGAAFWPTVIAAGLGAMCGDIVIFFFLKDKLADNIYRLLGEKTKARFKAVFRFRFFRWFLAFIGALIVASPLPDEIGLALLGFSKIKQKIFLPISFALNTIGLALIALAVKAID